MKRFKIRKCSYNLKNVLIIIIVTIFLMTLLLINTIGKKVSNNMLNISHTIVNYIETNSVNNNIKLDLLKEYKMDDLIIINYQENKVSTIDYNLENAYAILIQIKKGIIDNISNNMADIYNYNYKINKNNIIIEMPFYNYTDNLLLASLGPKVEAKLSIIELVDGSIKTKIKNYGINSLLVELYINFTISTNIVVPNKKEENCLNTYDILISSKVVQGEIPSIYNGLLEQSSEIINT